MKDHLEKLVLQKKHEEKKKKNIRCKELDSLHIICKTLSSSKEEIKILPNGIGN